MSKTKVSTDFDIFNPRTKSPRIDHTSERLAKLVRSASTAIPKSARNSLIGTNKLDYEILKLKNEYNDKNKVVPKNKDDHLEIIFELKK